MEKEIKNTVFTFLDFMNDKEVLEKMILTRDSKKKIFKLLNDLEENKISEEKNKIFINIEKAILDTIELTQDLYFILGEKANQIKKYLENNKENLLETKGTLELIKIEGGTNSHSFDVKIEFKNQDGKVFSYDETYTKDKTFAGDKITESF